MSDPTRRPGISDGADEVDALVTRLSRADGPRLSAPSLYTQVAAQVERRAERRRAGLQAVGAVAALAVAGGGVFGLVRLSSGGSASSADSSVRSDGAAASAGGSGRADARPATGAAEASSKALGGPATPGSVPGGATPGSAAPDCPEALPSDLGMPTYADSTHRLVATASGARVVICVYPLVAPGATTSPAPGATAPAAPAPAGGRAVAADAAWLTRVAALPAATDGGALRGQTCATTAPQAASAEDGRVYLLRLDYPGGGTSWLRVAAGRCEVLADNGAATSSRAQDLLAEVRTAYEAGTPLRG